MPSIRRLAPLLLLAGLRPAAAVASDHPIAVGKLTISRSANGREKLVLLVKDGSMPFPTPGSADDPVAGTPGGLRLDLADASADRASLTAPKGTGWRESTSMYGFADRDAPAGPSPIRQVSWRGARTLKLTARATGLPTTRPLGRVVVRLVAGTTRACGVVSGAGIRRDTPGDFVAVKAPAPDVADCSDASLGIAPPTTTTLATTTTTTTTSTSISTTTTILPPLLPLTVELASTAGSGACGRTEDGTGAARASVPCGTLALGDGGGTIPAAVLPDGAVVHFDIGTCGPPEPLGSCALTATTEAGPGFDCTTTGCFFGPPVPVPNAGLSACSVSTFAAPASGSVALLTGDTESSVRLSLHLFLTGVADQPCPRCSASGAPGAPGAGICDRGANAGGACTTTSSRGLSHDCLPGGTDGSLDLGSITADLAPVTTGTASLSAADGLFCAGQAHAGCFGDPGCRAMTVAGASPGVALGAALAPQPATLVSAFCVPSSGNPLVDASAGLPGPAVITLSGTVRSQL